MEDLSSVFAFYCTIIGICIIGLNWISYRLNQIHSMICEVLELCREYNNRNNVSDSYTWSFMKLPSVISMMWSFKSIKMESFLSKDIINRLKSK